jgi:hypothetical protein
MRVHLEEIQYEFGVKGSCRFRGSQFAHAGRQAFYKTQRE